MKKRVSPDEELMTALYTEHYAVLLGFISRYVHDRNRAEDLVQETLLRAWKHIDHLDTEPGRTRSYLLTIARNVHSGACSGAVPSVRCSSAPIELPDWKSLRRSRHTGVPHHGVGSTIATFTWPAIKAWIRVSVDPIRTTSPWMPS